MKKIFALSIFLSSTSTMASLDREQTNYIPEPLITTIINTNLEKKEIEESIKMHHNEIIKSMKEEVIKIDKSTFKLPEFNKGI